ncbi:MAG: dihydrodipicolinate synthase family protein [Deltaproteobacteria bacterium]|nr:dihydrodipicolinate synthase family protein [Deltaproteobacteria bacterium]
MDHLTAPRGLIVDLVTPLRANGEIDGRGLGRLLDRVLPHVQAVFIASPYAGEGVNLSVSQREDLFDKTLVVVRGRTPLFVWVTGGTQDDTGQILLLLLKKVETRKYSGPLFWVDTPLYYHSNRGLTLHYQNLCTIAKQSWMLHNDPELIRQVGRTFKRKNIRTAILKNLAGIQEIRGLIFLGPLERTGHYQKAVRKKHDFRIYDGQESHFLMYPSMSGVVSSGANLAPKAWRKITDASLNMPDGQGDYPDRLHQLLKTGVYLQKLAEICRSFPSPTIKSVLSKMEIIESPMSIMQSEVEEEKVRALIKEMNDYGDYPQ